MKNFLFFILFLFLINSLSGQNVRQIEYADTLHGVVIPDPYKWMEDIHSREVLKFVKAENKRTQKAVVKKTKKLSKEFDRARKHRQFVWPPRELYERPKGDYN
jgi:hypothetical protein